MFSLAIAVGIPVLLLGLFLAVRAWGEARTERRMAERQNAIKDRQLEAANRRPRTRNGLIERLRRGKF